MTFFTVMGTLILTGLGITLSFFRKGGIYNPVTSTDNETHIDLEPLPEAANASVSPVLPPTAALSPLEFSTPKNAFHSVRVICDEQGLTLDEKNLICACIYQESEFWNTAKCKNKNKAGVVTSTDWGICQVNDYFHIGKGKDFESVQFILNNPDRVVKWMINQYKAGNLGMWVSYSSGAYKRWLSPSSPMWGLKTV